MLSLSRWFLCLVFVWGACQAMALEPNVLLEQGGAQVTVADVDAFAERIPAQDRPGFFSGPKRVEQVLQNLLTQKLVVNDVRRKQQAVTDPVLRNAPEESEEELYRQQMARLKDASSIPNLDLLAQEQYLAHKSRYLEHGAIRVAYLKKAMEEERPRGAPIAASIVAVKAQMQALSDRIGGDAAEFERVFEHYSSEKRDDGVEAGVLDNVNTDRYPDALSAAARALDEKHGVSAPVQTPLEVYILKLVSREPDRQLSFEEVKDSLIEAKRNEYVRRETEEYLGSLRTTPLEINEEAIQALLDRYLQGPAEGHE